MQGSRNRLLNYLVERESIEDLLLSTSPNSNLLRRDRRHRILAVPRILDHYQILRNAISRRQKLSAHTGSQQGNAITYCHHDDQKEHALRGRTFGRCKWNIFLTDLAS
jgi:hypothetical protein